LAKGTSNSKDNIGKMIIDIEKRLDEH